MINRRGPWRYLEAVEFATLDWVDWFNTRRLSEPIGHVPPAKYEQAYYRAHGTPMGGRSHVTKTSENRGRFNVSGIFSIDIPQIAGRSPFPDSP